MAVLALPLSFTNSFWSQDYRHGLEVLFSKLEQGIAENNEIIAFVRVRSSSHYARGPWLTFLSLTGPRAGRETAGRRPHKPCADRCSWCGVLVPLLIAVLK